MKKIKRSKFINSFKRNFSVSFADIIKSFCILALAAFACYFINIGTNNQGQVSLIFVLAVLIVSRVTSGYSCGIISSAISVVFINFVFTYPYFSLNFTLSGYPLTFVTMFAVTITVSTLTSRVKLQEEIHLETEKEKLRANLLRAVSHDIRTPLTSIGGSAAAILESSDNMPRSEQIRLLESISDESSNLIRTVENLLSVTKLNGKASILKNDEMVEEVVSEAVSRFKKYHQDVKVEAKLPAIPLFVPMDGLLIEQVLINLMDNAVTHGKSTTKISIDVSENNKSIVFSVSDNGKGLDKEVVQKLENGFYSFESTAGSDSHRNMGIGLSVCESIINAHNGRMKCRNLDEGGAKFVFTLPIN